jgi:hypothetical protein
MFGVLIAGVFSMLTSGVGVTAPLYASQVFSAISGERKGYVTCVHLMVLVLFIGHFLKGMHVVKVADKCDTIGIPSTNSNQILKTGRNDAIEVKTVISARRKNAAVALEK